MLQVEKIPLSQNSTIVWIHNIQIQELKILALSLPNGM